MIVCPGVLGFRTDLEVFRVQRSRAIRFGVEGLGSLGVWVLGLGALVTSPYMFKLILSRSAGLNHI